MNDWTRRRCEIPPNTAVLIGNGGSVDAVPRAFWARCEAPDVLLAGTNRALCFKALRSVRLDAMVIRDSYRNLWHTQEWGERYHEELWKPAECWKVGPAHRRVTHCDEYVRFAGGWQHEPGRDRNGELAVMKNSSVVLMAANWAYLQGAREIFLIGVDYRGRHARMIGPYESQSPGWEGQYDRPVPDYIERQFGEAARAVEWAGRRVVNLSPDTKLTSVPMAEWRSAAIWTPQARRNESP